jgi:hypothetical protein
MTFGQIYGALKKGRWVGRSTKENERLSLMDGRILKSICADGEVLVYVNSDVTLTADDLLADDWVVYN